MKSPLKHIILDAPFEDEHTCPKVEVIEVDEKMDEILWEGKPTNTNWIFGKREIPLSEIELFAKYVFLVGFGIIFLVFLFSRSVWLFILFNSLWGVSLVAYEFLSYIIISQISYSFSKNHVTFRNAFWFSKKEIPLKKIKNISYSKSIYPEAGTILISFTNNKKWKFDSIKNAHQVQELLKKTIQQNNNYEKPNS